MVLRSLPFVLCLASAARASTPIATTVVQANMSTIYTGTVNSSHQVLFQFEGVDSDRSALRIYSYAPNAGRQFPLAVVVRQQRDVLSWELPVVLGDGEYRSVNRTLCPFSGGSSRQIVVIVSTPSASDLTFAVGLYRQQRFDMDLDAEVVARVSASTPIFYRFDWPEGIDRALLKFESPDEICTVLSVQNVSCPVYDMDWNVKFEGFYQTVDRLSGLAFTKDVFPRGLFVVLVVRSDDSACHEVKSLQGDLGSRELNATPLTPVRVKTVRLKIVSQLTSDEYLLATVGALGMFLAMYVLVIVVSCVIVVRRSRQQPSPPPPPTETTPLIRGSVQEEGGSGDAPEAITTAVEVYVSEDEAADPVVRLADDDEDSSLDETSIDMLLDVEWEKEIFRTKRFPFVSDLSRKSSKVLSKKLSLYHWNLWTVAIFYSLPVVQLMITYQRVTNSTGDMDICYYNYLCANPLGVLSDFNHVYSNVGYVLLGLLFMGVTRFKEMGSYRRRVFACGNVQLLNEPQQGIPQHFGMFYAMGSALIMEGVMSACYHVCPNHTNFQFDTAFMYTISILILLKIYQIRHPDITANAYTAFGVLALIILIGVVGVLDGTVLFWTLFTAVHVLSCLVLSLQVYYMGRFKINAGMFKRLWLTCVSETRAFAGGRWYGLMPVYPDRMILLLVMNAFNWGLSVYGVSKIAREGGDFASFLLAIFITNVMLYTSFYMVMKLRYHEKITMQPAIYTALSVFSWAGAMYFFFNKSTTWHLSPAQSRHYNKECVLFHFYDNHDIWHFLSATSLFLSFMILLTLDDDLRTVPREKIPVF